MKKLVIVLLLSGLFLLSSRKVSAQITWTEIFPTGMAEDGYWTALASDADGSNLIVSDGNYGGKLYISSDGGSSWTETIPATLGGSQWWGDASSNADGTKLIVTSYPGRVYVSLNGGESWNETRPTGTDVNRSWISISMSADGSRLLATDFGGRVYISTNGGTSWSETMPTGAAVDRSWWTSAMSDDGSHLIAAITGGRVYISTNGGTSWSETMPTGAAENRNWQTVAVDGNGSNFYATQTSTGRIYKSSNNGLSWTELLPAGSPVYKPWSIDSDNDGSHLLVTDVDYFGKLYLSEDSGTSWEEIETPVELNGSQYWWEISINADGSNFIASAYAGRIFKRSALPDSTPTQSPPSSSSNAISSAVESASIASNPNIILGWALPIMAGPNFIGLHGFIPNTNITSDESRLASVFIDRTTHHDDLNIHHSDINWLNILMFWNNPDEVKLPWTQGFNTVSEISKIEAKSSFNGYPVEATDNPYIILLGYNKESLGKIDPGKLKIARFNETSKKWETIKGSYVYPEGKIATTTNKFGYFSVVYPRSLWGQ